MKYYKVINTTITILIMVIVSNIYGSDKKAESRINLDHADLMRSDNDVRHLIGNVRISHGIKIITSNRARYDSKSGIIDLTGNVVLFEPEQKMIANRITYYEATGNYEAVGNTDFNRQDSIRIRCNIAKYYEDSDMMDLNSNVIIDNLSDGATITGERGKWYNRKNLAVITGKPVYRLPPTDNSEEDTLVINSEKITFYQNSNSALFSGEVILELDELYSVSDSLMHMPDSSLTILSGAPVIWRGADKLSGNRIFLYFEDRELRNIVVNGEAVIRSEAHLDEDIFNTLSGDKLDISIINDSTQLVLAQGDAKGEYHIWDEDDIYRGENISTANSIEILLYGNKARSLDLSGATSGTFYPPAYVPEVNTDTEIDRDRLGIN